MEQQSFQSIKMCYLKYLKKHLTNQKGMTLIELLAVLLIISVITAISIPIFIGQGEKARLSTHQTNINTIVSVVELYDYEKGFSYDTARNLGLFTNEHEIITSGFLKEVPENPWQETNQPFADFKYYIGKDSRGLFHIVLADGTNTPDPANILGEVNGAVEVVTLDSVISPSLNVRWTLN